MSTIRDVAKLADVSTATVSRVLNKDMTYKMTDETRKRVLDAVQTLDYQFHEQKRRQDTSVRKQDNVKLGCVLSVTRKKYDDPYFMSILSAIESRLGEKGLYISYIRNGAELENESVLTSISKEHIDGMILMENLDDEAYSYLHHLIPHIVGIDTQHRDIDNVGYDHIEAATIAVEHLLKRGKREIGFIGGHGNEKSISCSQRYKGYYLAMMKAGLPLNQKWNIDCDWDEETCEQRVDQLCKSGELPSAFFAASDLMAMAALNALHKNNIEVPKQVAVVGISDIEVSKYSYPPLSTVHVPVNEIGVIAADMLVARLNGYELIPQRIVLPTELVAREST